MTGQLRAELLKQRSTQTTLYLFLAMFGLVGLAVALHVLALGAASLSTRSDQLNVFEVGTKVGMIFAGLVGAMAITAELRHGTIRPTFLVTPRRGQVIAAKLVVSGMAGLVFGLLAGPPQPASPSPHAGSTGSSPAATTSSSSWEGPRRRRPGAVPRQ